MWLSFSHFTYVYFESEKSLDMQKNNKKTSLLLHRYALRRKDMSSQASVMSCPR